MMQYAERHLQTAETIIREYNGVIPLHHYLKQFFSANKKYGSKDRKAITHACYCYYRLGSSLKQYSIGDKLRAGIFLCNEKPGVWQQLYKDSWLNNWSKEVSQRIAFVSSELSLYTEEIFPLNNELSDEIEKESFITSHLIQPDLFIRIRPGKAKKVIEQLNHATILFRQVNDHCIAISNSTKVDTVLSINKDVVVQDLSSQRIGELLSTINHQPSTIKVWDCCAASGGKSILAYDIFDKIELTVSDVRVSIIQNLKKRFSEAGIKSYKSFVADITNNYQPSTINYDLIICDAPCSGSGTWGRTPEQLSFFGRDRIEYYTSLQKKIALNVIPSLKKNGHLLYITCSVFKQENEDVVEYILANSSLQLVNMQYLEGYQQKADTMFAALFISAP